MAALEGEFLFLNHRLRMRLLSGWWVCHFSLLRWRGQQQKIEGCPVRVEGIAKFIFYAIGVLIVSGK